MHLGFKLIDYQPNQTKSVKSVKIAKSAKSAVSTKLPTNQTNQSISLSTNQSTNQSEPLASTTLNIIYIFVLHSQAMSMNTDRHTFLCCDSLTAHDRIRHTVTAKTLDTDVTGPHLTHNSLGVNLGDKLGQLEA